MKTILLLLVIPVLFGFYLINSDSTNNPPLSNQIITPSPTPNQSKYFLPINNFYSRITKKPFGIYITPQTSPVSPEKFTGFHTGVDVEYQDIDSDIPIFSIGNGTVLYSGMVNGYGGFIAIKHNEFISIYGHLDPSSLVKNNANVTQDQQIGILGRGFTLQTSGERKHLHFAILKSEPLDFRGYVSSESELSNWLNPTIFLSE